MKMAIFPQLYFSPNSNLFLISCFKYMESRLFRSFIDLSFIHLSSQSYLFILNTFSFSFFSTLFFIIFPFWHGIETICNTFPLHHYIKLEVEISLNLPTEMCTFFTIYHHQYHYNFLFLVRESDSTEICLHLHETSQL